MTVLIDESVQTTSNPRPTQPGRSRVFNGTDNLAVVDALTAIINKNVSFSVSLWFKRPDVAADRRTLLAAKLDTGSRWSLQTAGAGVQSGMFDGSVFQGRCSHSAGVVINTWHHIALTYDISIADRDARMVSYLDGIKSDGTTNSFTSGGSELGAQIGSRVDGQDLMLGNLFDLRVFNRVLTGSEILSLRDSRTGGELGPAGYHWWKLDGSHPTWVFDCGGQGLHGAFTGTVATEDSTITPRSFQNDVGFTGQQNIVQESRSSNWRVRDTGGGPQVSIGPEQPDGWFLLTQLTNESQSWASPPSSSAEAGTTSGDVTVRAFCRANTPGDLGDAFSINITGGATYVEGSARIISGPGTVVDSPTAAYVVGLDRDTETIFESDWTGWNGNPGFIGHYPAASASTLPGGSTWVKAPMIVNTSDLPIRTYSRQPGISSIGPIPRDESNIGFDVLGNPLEFAGRVPRDAELVNGSAVAFDGESGTYGLATLDPSQYPSFPFSLEFQISDPQMDDTLAHQMSAFGTASNSEYFSVQYRHTVTPTIRVNRRNVLINDSIDYYIQLSEGDVVRCDFISPTEVEVFVNGVSLGVQTGPEALLIAPRERVVIGNYRFTSTNAGSRSTLCNCKYYRGDSLICHWPMTEGGGLVLYDIVNRRDATLAGGATWATQNAYHRNELMGFDQIYQTATGEASAGVGPAIIPASGDFVLRLWFIVREYVADVDQNTYLFRQGGSATGHNYATIRPASDNRELRWFKNGETSTTISSGFTIDLDVPYFVEFAVEGGQRLIRINGQQFGESRATANDWALEDFVIGSTSTTFQGNVEYAGLEVEVGGVKTSIFDMVSSAGGPRDIVTGAEYTPQASGVQKRVPADQAGNSLLIPGNPPTNPAGVRLNRAESGHNFKPEPLAPWVGAAESETTLTYPSDVTGHNVRLFFTGVELSSVEPLDFSCWFYVPDLSSSRILMRSGNTSNFRLRVLADGSIVAQNGGSDFGSVGGLVQENEWFHVRWTYDGNGNTGQVRVHVNGALVVSGTNDATDPDPSPTSSVRILSGGGGGSYPDARARSLNIICRNQLAYRSALSADQTLQDYDGFCVSVDEDIPNVYPVQNIPLPTDHRAAEPLPPQMGSVIEPDSPYGEREIDITSQRPFDTPVADGPSYVQIGTLAASAWDTSGPDPDNYPVTEYDYFSPWYYVLANNGEKITL